MKLRHLFMSIAATVLGLSAVVACQTQIEETDDTLSVTPNKSMTFKASGNQDVTLTVTTNAKTWDFSAPEWINGVMSENSLVLKISDNTSGEQRFGRIVITAGNATPVNINVAQDAANGDSGSGDITGNGPKATVVADTKTIFTLDSKLEKSLTLKLSLKEAATETVEASLVFDAQHIDEYNYVNKTHFELFPEAGANLANVKLTVAAGSKESNEVTLTVKGNDAMANGIAYVIPIKVESNSLTFDKGANRANFLVMKNAPSKKDVRNVLYYEVNDVNPLCALEYVLEDGTPFFDAVVIFAANINYDQENQLVYLHNNKNVQALLDETDVYIQPLRKAGIKVYLGLLGNHNPAGLCQLSDYGAQEFAAEVALACKQYRLDGVNLDDEYSPKITEHDNYNATWLAPTSVAAGSRLCYELKKALKKECYWPTDVTYFILGALTQCLPVTDLETGEVHQPSDFVDLVIPNYTLNFSFVNSARPYGGLTKKNCAAISIELNKPDYQISNSILITEANAKKWKNDGYGWIMWYALNSDPNCNKLYNGPASYNYINIIAKGLYGQSVVKPKGYYRRLDEGKFSPEFYQYQ